MAIKKSGDPLGRNPLNRGIFSKTSSPKDELLSSSQEQESANLKPETTFKEIEAIDLKVETRFLEDEPTEPVNLRMTIAANDRINDCIVVRRRSGKKRIKKERLVQAALELFLSLPIDLNNLESEEELKEKLAEIRSKLISG